MKIKCRIGGTSFIINVTQNFLLRDIALQHFTAKSINVDLDEYCFKIPHYDFFLELDQTVNDLLNVAWVFNDKESLEEGIATSILLIRKAERGDRIQREQLSVDPTIEASCAGYLYKRGGSLGNFATFKKRYFVLQSNTLYYQETPNTPILGFIPTSGISIKLRPEVQYKDKIAFELTTLSGTRNYILCADQTDFSQFHQAIDELQLRRCKSLVVTLAEELLNRDVTQMQGIFRISGTKDQVEWLHYQFEMSENPDLTEISNEVLSSVIKLQLRSLESPIIPFGLYSEYLRLGKMSPQATDRVEYAIQCVAKLPTSQRHFLHYLCRMMKKISNHASANLMNSKNLSIVIGPNLLRPQKETTQTAMNDNQYVLTAVQLLIDEVDAVFGPDLSLHAPDHDQISAQQQRHRSSTIANMQNSYVQQQSRRARNSISEIDPSLTFVADLKQAMNASKTLGMKIDELKHQHDLVMGKWSDLIVAIKANPQNSMHMSTFILNQSEIDVRFVDDGLVKLKQIFTNLNDLTELLTPQTTCSNLQLPPTPSHSSMVSPNSQGRAPPPPPPVATPRSSQAQTATFVPPQPPPPSMPNIPTKTIPPPPQPPQLPQPTTLPPPPAVFDDFANDQYSEDSAEDCPPPPPSSDYY